MRIAALSAIAALASLSACDQPKPRGPSPEASAERVIPSVAGPAPPAPAWASAAVGKALREVFPGTGTCRGSTDIVQQTYSGSPAGVQIHGWGWDPAKAARIDRVVLVDKDQRIIGAGEGGVRRPDVTAAVPEITDGATGWNADAPVTSGALEAYGVLGDGKTICPLGRIQF